MFAAVLLAALLIGCGGTPAGATDPTFVRTANVAIDDDPGW